MCRKRMINLLAAAVITALGLTLSGCGAESKTADQAVNADEAESTAETKSTAAAVSAVSASEAPEEGDAESEGGTEGTFVVMDEETAKIVCTGLFRISPDEKDMGEEDLKAGISFEVTNRGEAEIIVDIRDLKVGAKTVSRKLLEGNVIEPDTTQVFRYGILEPEPEDGTKPVDTAGDLDWTAVTEQGITGTIQVQDLDGILAKAEFAAAG